MKLTDIYIYPVKSLGGIRLENSPVTPQGLIYDRKFMIVDNEAHKHLTQRQIPEMALLKVEIKNDEVIICDTQGIQSDLHLPLHPETSELLEVSVWNDTLTALHISAEIDEWLGTVLNTDCKLVYMHDEQSRKVKEKYAPNGAFVSFADRTPFLIIGEESLNDLNNRMDHPLPMNRFRPNLVFTGGQPYEEDYWKSFQVGQTVFDGAGPCGRCKVTTIDQETAEKGAEPLATLSTYRKPEKSVLFGQLLTWVRGDSIAVGDEIKLLETAQLP